MKTRKSLVGMGVLAAALVAGGAMAQGAKNPLWYIHQEAAKPSMLGQWNATTLEVMRMAAKVKAPTMRKGIVREGDDLNFLFAAPIDGFAGIGALNADFEKMAQADPKAFTDLMQR